MATTNYAIYILALGRFPIWILLAVAGSTIVLCAAKVRRDKIKERRWRRRGQWRLL